MRELIALSFSARPIYKFEDRSSSCGVPAIAATLERSILLPEDMMRFFEPYIARFSGRCHRNALLRIVTFASHARMGK
jgi:hypothetical protein